jgi:hypothetical protein
VGEDVKRNTGQVEQLFRGRVGELEGKMKDIIDENLKKGRRLTFEV